MGNDLANDGGRKARRDPCAFSQLTCTDTAYVKPVLQARGALMHLAEDINYITKKPP